jgi:FkbM family methyltransferase
MNTELVVIGAHNGSKLANIIELASQNGPVILIEPVDWLFDQLVNRFQKFKNIVFINKAVIDETNTKKIKFNAPTKQASEVNTVADQLGSIVNEHAENSISGINKYFKCVDVPAVTFIQLFKDLNVKSLNNLIIDTEGLDARLLLSFPFYQIKPNTILFEFKHSDGTMRVGKNLANVLMLLNQIGYTIHPVDHENFYAILQ